MWTLDTFLAAKDSAVVQVDLRVSQEIHATEGPILSQKEELCVEHCNLLARSDLHEECAWCYTIGSASEIYTNTSLVIDIRTTSLVIV